jgi:TRAP-type C4-dicarboxylate transport system permease small subunit
MILTFLGLAISGGLFAFAMIMSNRPIVPGEVRMFPYTALMFISIMAIIVLVGHLITLVTGTPLVGKRSGM